MKYLQENQQLVRKLMGGLKSNRQLLEHAKHQGFPKI